MVVVHGTFARASREGEEPRWFEPGGRYCRDLDARLERLNSPARTWAHLEEGFEPFSWSGANDWLERYRAGKALRRYINRLRKAGWRVHLVAHSHGTTAGLVAFSDRAGDLKADELASFTSLGCPFFMPQAGYSLRELASWARLIFGALLWLLLGVFSLIEIKRLQEAGSFSRQLLSDWSYLSDTVWMALLGAALVAAVWSKGLLIWRRFQRAHPHHQLFGHRARSTALRPMATPRLLVIHSDDEVQKLLRELLARQGWPQQRVSLWSRCASLLQSIRATARYLLFRDRVNYPSGLWGLVASAVALVFALGILSADGGGLQVYLFFLLIALVVAVPRALEFLVSAPARLVEGLAYACSAIPSAVAPGFVAKRMRTSLRRFVLGLAGAPFHPDSVKVGQVPWIGMAPSWDLELSEEAVEAATARRNHGVQETLERVLDVAQREQWTFGQFEGLLREAGSNLDLVHSAYMVDQEPIGWTAQWIAATEKQREQVTEELQRNFKDGEPATPAWGLTRLQNLVRYQRQSPSKVA